MSRLKRRTSFCSLLLLLQFGFAQQVSFRIQPLHPIDQLRAQALKEQPPQEQGSFRKPDLVELVNSIPRSSSTCVTPLRTIFWELLCIPRRAYLQRPAAEALVRANQELKAKGYGLIIHDGYRPWYVTEIFWTATPDDKKIFVANPKEAPGIIADVRSTCPYTI